MSDFESELRAEIDQLFAGLETLSYYDYLGLAPDTDYVAVRDAFYSRAQRYHPDRYVRGEYGDLRARVYDVFKRMTEAYNVLSDPELRARYGEAMRDGEHRLPLAARARRLGVDERKLNNSFARIYLRAANEKLDRGDLTGAWIDVELGLTLEESEPLRKLHSEIVRRAATAVL